MTSTVRVVLHFLVELASKLLPVSCSVVDDGTLAERRGSLSVDDEGTPTQNTMLIENGILRGYMQDKLNARLMNVAATGNGRRQSYAHVPMPRMTNTYMLPGQDVPEDIVRSVSRGVYAEFWWWFCRYHFRAFRVFRY